MKKKTTKRRTATGRRGGRTSIYPFRTLKRSETFFIMGRDKEDYLRSHASRIGATTSKVFTVSRVDRTAGAGIEVKRIK